MTTQTVNNKFIYECIDCGKQFFTNEVIYLCASCSKENDGSKPPKGVLKVVYNYSDALKNY
jgi:DNA-directed RNA polymerase subunit RPC12/RpoP